MGTAFKIVESASAKNTALAASGSEVLITEPTNHALHWNYLEVYNRDATTDIEVRLDSQATGAKVFVVPVGAFLLIEAEEGIKFKEVTNVNLDTANAQTVNAILFKAAYKVPVTGVE